MDEIKKNEGIKYSENNKTDIYLDLECFESPFSIIKKVVFYSVQSWVDRSSMNYDWVGKGSVYLKN